MKTRKKTTRVVVSILAVAILALLPLSTRAGSLKPSAPPGLMMKTLDEIEPRVPVQTLPGDANSLYVISEAGSYYLTGNITGEPNKCGIKVAAGNVTLDLMGFALIGVPGSLDGITVKSVVWDETENPKAGVGNGTIRDWGGNGIHLMEYLEPTHLQLEELSVHNNGGHGIFDETENPKGFQIEKLSAHNNGGDGIRIRGGFGHMEDVSFCHNGGNGIFAYDGFLKIDGGSVSNNDANGLVVDGNSCCHIEDVAFTYNGGDVIHILGMMTNVDAYSSYASHNGGHGVFVYGMLDAYQVLASHNGGVGIIVNGSGNLNQCTAVGNGAAGIQVGSGSTVKNCAARGNTGDGILVPSNCQVVGNTCESNGPSGDVDAAGIHATGSGNRIEANHVINNDVGIDVGSAGNLIIRNSARGNTSNYDIASGNTVGPIIDDSDIATDSNPHANYAF